MQDALIIFDTTMRDGEQSPGASMTKEEKVRIGKQLERLRVDVIEAGFAAASPGDFEAIRAVAEAVRESTICSLARASEIDIRRAGEAVAPAERKRIHTFIATSPIHMKLKLRMSEEQVLEAAVKAVKFARQFTDDVEFSAEDAVRSEVDFLCRVFEATIDAGARTINVPDTVGYSVPQNWGELFRTLIERVPNSDKAVWSTHCHNDLGMAVANSLAAVMNGARQVECTINGLGERAGNASLEEVVMAVRTRPDIFPCRTGIDTPQIVPASKLVSTITGYPVQPNKAVVGANAFAHESGIHQDGVLKHAATYEIMTPESVGLTKSNIVLGKLSGRHAFKDKLAQLGFEPDDAELNEAFRRFKDLADKKREIFDEDIVALIDDSRSIASQRIRFVSLQVVAGSKGPQLADLELEIDGKVENVQARGNGPIDAIFNAIRKLVPHTAALQLYQVHAVTGGTDAQAEVTVRLEEEGKTVNGQGADADTLVASCRAYVHALNKLLVKREKREPPAMTATAR
ncbi:MAG TPA: 2-isopropylmalate synthase [Usitatibacteraceae bacterium]|nr:2-isopropylmalate synthase [Usitatibacteraceae bacterium]